MPTINHPHIGQQPDICGGSPCINGTRIPVRIIVAYVLQFGLTPEDLLGYYPHLSLASIYDAIAYYYDNRQALDADLAANEVPEPSNLSST
jgi:uncharacterized protein (DUF433 family)